MIEIRTGQTERLAFLHEQERSFVQFTAARAAFAFVDYLLKHDQLRWSFQFCGQLLSLPCLGSVRGEPAKYPLIKFTLGRGARSAVAGIWNLPEYDRARIMGENHFGLLERNIGICQSVYEQDGHSCGRSRSLW